MTDIVERFHVTQAGKIFIVEDKERPEFYLQTTDEQWASEMAQALLRHHYWQKDEIESAEKEAHLTKQLIDSGLEVTALRSRVERLEHEKEAAKDAYTDLEQYALYTDVSAKPPIGKLVAILYLPVQAPGGKPKVHAGRWSGEHWFFLDHDKMLRVIKEVLAWKNIDPIYSAEELPPTQENDDE